MEYKIGDEVIINSWDYAKIKLPQNGIIDLIDSGKNKPYAIWIEEDQYRKKGLWFFGKHEFELKSKDLTINNFEIW